MRHGLVVTVFIGAFAAASAANAQTPPPAPAQVEPAAGAARFQPITLRWNPVVDPDGPIGSYTWQVGTSSSFTTIVLSGFTQESLPGIPVPTQDRVSGLPLGTYFWRVKASQTVGGTIGSIESAWSTVRTFTVSRLSPSRVRPASRRRVMGRDFTRSSSLTSNGPPSRMRSTTCSSLSPPAQCPARAGEELGWSRGQLVGGAPLHGG